MSNFFGRQVQVVISSDTEQITIPEDINTLENLQIDFTISGTSTGSSAKSNEVSLTNLSETTRNFIKKEGQKVEIFAGYQALGVAKIAQGQITDVDKIDRQTTDIITRLKFAESIFDINNLVFSKSYQGSVTMTSILNDAFVDTTFTFRNFQVIPNITFTGFAFHGKTKDLLAKILTPNKINWVVSGEKIIFNTVGKPINTDLVFKISKSTGMVGVPKPTQNSGVEVKTLLNTTINIADKINLDSQFIKGEFKVISILHKGSSRAGDFTTTMDCVTIK